MPSVLNTAILKEEFGIENDVNRLFIGVDYESMNPVALQWSTNNILALSGQESNGRKNFLSYLLHEIAKVNGKLFVIDDGNGELAYTKEMAVTELYTKSVTDVAELLARVDQYLTERYNARMIGELLGDMLVPIVLLVQNREVLGYVDKDKSLLSMMEDITSKYAGLNGVIVFSNLENEAVGYKSPAILKSLYKAMSFMLFEDVDKIKIFSITSDERRRFARQLQTDEVYYSVGEGIMKLKMVK